MECHTMGPILKRRILIRLIKMNTQPLSDSKDFVEIEILPDFVKLRPGFTRCPECDGLSLHFDHKIFNQDNLQYEYIAQYRQCNKSKKFFKTN